MPSTSVHLPEDLIRRLDRAAKRRRVSRNRLIMEACRAIVGEGERDWPEGFFSRDHLSGRERALLHDTFDDWLGGLEEARRSKTRAPF